VTCILTTSTTFLLFSVAFFIADLTYSFANRDAPLDFCRIIPQSCCGRTHGLCRFFSYLPCFNMHDTQRILVGDEIDGLGCLANHGQHSHNHDPHVARRHSLSVGAVNTAQRIAKVLHEFGSVITGLELPVYPLGLYGNHLSVVALGNARPQKTIPVVEIVAQHMLAMPLKDANCFPGMRLTT
jgi:hypothetical protein